MKYRQVVMYGQIQQQELTNGNDKDKTWQKLKYLNMTELQQTIPT